MAPSLRLYKREKLCSPTAIESLFTARDTAACKALAWPLRAVWRRGEPSPGANPRFVISVPKKRLRHAVDRVAMRRRIREAYRLNRNLIDMSAPVDIAFVYVGDRLTAYADVERAMRRLLRSIDAPPAGEGRDR